MFSFALRSCCVEHRTQMSIGKVKVSCHPLTQKQSCLGCEALSQWRNNETFECKNKITNSSDLKMYLPSLVTSCQTP